MTDQAQDGQTWTERLIERSVVLFAQAMVVLGATAAVYGFFVAMFFFCCGVETLVYFHPSRSPLGSIVTIVVVWPLIGLLCLALQGGPREILDIVARGVRRLLRGMDSDRKT
jgi:membrane associated rhomboid family serine protease